MRPEDNKEDIMSEVTKWDIPNGLLEEVLNMDELNAATKNGCTQYLGDQIGAVTFLQPPPTATQVTPATLNIPV